MKTQTGSLPPISVAHLVDALIRETGLEGKHLADAVLREVAQKKKKAGYLIDWDLSGFWYEHYAIDENGEVATPNQQKRWIIEDLEASSRRRLPADTRLGRVEEDEGDGEGDGEPTSFSSTVLLVPSSPRNVSSPSQLIHFPYNPILEDFAPILNHLCSLTLAQYPHLDRDDLMQEGRIALWRATITYQGRSLFVTYAYRAIKQGMIKYAAREESRQRGRVFGDDSSVVWLPTGSDCDRDGYLDTIDMLRETKDGHLLLLHAAGYRDNDLAERNVRVRRYRARKQLEEMLAA